MDKTAHEIVADYLRAHDEFDGLVNPGCCACEPDDIAPCGGIGVFCEPGWQLVFEKSDCSEDDIDAGCDGDCKWHMHAGPRPRHQSTPTPAASPSSPEGSGTGTQEDDRDE